MSESDRIIADRRREESRDWWTAWILVAAHAPLLVAMGRDLPPVFSVFFGAFPVLLWAAAVAAAGEPPR